MKYSEIILKNYLNLIKETELKTIIKRGTEIYVVNSTFTISGKFVTSIMPVDENGNVYANTEKLFEEYEHYDEMKARHEQLVKEWV